MNKKNIEKMFPGAIERMDQGKCSVCGEKIRPEEFRDELSLKEHAIMGTCQLCINKTFR